MCGSPGGRLFGTEGGCGVIPAFAERSGAGLGLGSALRSPGGGWSPGGRREGRGSRGSAEGAGGPEGLRRVVAAGSGGRVAAGSAGLGGRGAGRGRRPACVLMLPVRWALVSVQLSGDRRPQLRGPALSLQPPPQPGGACLRPPEWCYSSQASARDPRPLYPLPWSRSSGSLLPDAP